MPQNLHWVSYNGDTGRKDSQQRSQINSFLNRTKSRQKYERLRLGPSLAVNWEAGRSRYGHDEQPSLPPKTSPENVLPLGIWRQELPKSTRATSNRHRSKDNDHKSTAIVSIENHYITSNPVEPFGAMAVEIKPEWYTGLEYWIYGFDPAICRQQRVAGIYSASRAGHFALRFRNEALFHATMAVAYNSFDNLSHSYDAQAPSIRVLYHRGKALSSLSAQLTSMQIKSSVIFQTILNLMVVDSTWLDFDSLSKHQVGLRSLERLELEDPVWSKILKRLMETYMPNVLWIENI
ncbi:hypothetical protein PV08_10038 [Exophiala spinifera]|uniref:Uncharacterized protein n=1 Tax=Exophiala spinifera TaxID=91928 RepID=A0A0D2BHB2_9EURO|nr:uncharacterized protein PV08_10038 [Exophiala spinifera]KIW10739.1 hypothetical protein PV08_10038 [Exophiala spinifera]